MKQTRRRDCRYPGCPEISFVEYDSKKSMREDHNTRPWFCLRHSSPADVLSIEQPVITKILENIKKPYGLFWDGHTGYKHGPGMQAWAGDFPEGTKLEITYRIILPAEATTCP